MKRKYLAIILAAVFVLASIACSSGSARRAETAPASAYGGYASNSKAANQMSWASDEAVEAPMEMEEDYSFTTASQSGGLQSVSAESARKLIRDADLSVETKEFDQIIPAIEQQVAGVGGYIESMNESGNSYRSNNYRYAYIGARIPADRLDEFLNVVDGLGNVTNKNLSTRDVTSNYVDIESRLAVLETEKESLQNIMKNADTTVDMLETQSRLYDVIEEIESYEAQKRTYDSLVSYSTVSINVQEVVDLTPVKEESRWEELVRRFTTSLGDLGDAIVDFGIGFVVALPWILVIGGVSTAIFLAIFLPIRAKVRKNKKKQAAE